MYLFPPDVGVVIHRGSSKDINALIILGSPKNSLQNIHLAMIQALRVHDSAFPKLAPGIVRIVSSIFLNNINQYTVSPTSLSGP